MKRILLLLLIAILCFVLVACDGGNEGPAKETSTPDISAEPTATPEVTRVPDPEVDGIIFNFYYANDYAYSQITDMVQCDYDNVEGKGLAIYPVSEDPSVYLDAIGPNGEEVNLNDYPVFKIRLLNQTASDKFELFIVRGADIPTADDLITKTVTANQEEFIDLVFDLREIKSTKFFEENDGVVTWMRLDLINLSPVKEEIEDAARSDTFMIFVDYLGFFKSVEDANGWNPSHLDS